MSATYDLDCIVRPWKINIPTHENAALRMMLEGKGFEVSRAKPRAHLLCQLKRAHQGLLYYESCTNKELVRFVHDRGVRIASSTRRHLIAALEKADDAIQFTRLPDLPVELRERILAAHMSFIGRTDRTRNQEFPPILRTSQAIRREALPVFNKFVAYEVAINGLDKCAAGLKPDQKTTLQLRQFRTHWNATLRGEYVKFLKNTAKSRLFRISCGYWYDIHYFEITLYRCQEKGVYKTTSSFKEAWKLGERKAELDKLIWKEFSEFSTVLFKRIGGEPWDEASIDELCAKVDVIVAAAQAIMLSSKE